MGLKYSITHNGNTWNSSSDLDTISLQNGSVTSSITSAGTRTLHTQGLYMPNNLVIGAKTLNCSGKIMSGNVEINAEDAVVYLPVGGRIFYIHNDNGATYKFYDSSKNIISTQTVAGLANAIYYTVSGTPTADKFYVYDTTNGLQTGKQWGKYGTQIGSSGVAPYRTDGIGYGKINTNACLATTSWESDSVFSYIQNCRDNLLNGCNDWFIASEAEQDQLRSSGLVNWYSSNYIWSSVERNSYCAYLWYYFDSRWDFNDKNYSFCCFAARAF